MNPSMFRVVLLGLSSAATSAHAAIGEMGTGIPAFGQYAASQGGHVAVWSLSNSSIPMPTGCTALYLLPSVFGTEPYKIAIATLLAAKVAEKRVRFYSHTENGCNVDYVQIVD
jgi:hypothetical protein